MTRLVTCGFGLRIPDLYIMTARVAARIAMTKTPPPQDAARRDRLSAALRENLKRRKAQARARANQPDMDATDDDLQALDDDARRNEDPA
jgi:ABC-type Fe3+/spermidine/putrescine transport system ATPase subunit